MIKVGDLVRLNPEHHGGMDNLVLVVEVRDDVLPHELIVRMQGYNGEISIYEDEVEVISEVLHKQG